MIFFKKKVLSKYFVDISLGRVYFKELSNRLIVDARIVSERRDGTLSNETYIAFIERSLINLKKRDYFKLSAKDGSIIRDKVVEILKDYNLVIEEEPVEKFSDEEKRWFEDRFKESMSKFGNN